MMLLLPAVATLLGTALVLALLRPPRRVRAGTSLPAREALTWIEGACRRAEEAGFAVARDEGFAVELRARRPWRQRLILSVRPDGHRAPAEVTHEFGGGAGDPAQRRYAEDLARFVLSGGAVPVARLIATGAVSALVAAIVGVPLALVDRESALVWACCVTAAAALSLVVGLVRRRAGHALSAGAIVVALLTMLPAREPSGPIG